MLYKLTQNADRVDVLKGLGLVLPFSSYKPDIDKALNFDKFTVSNMDIPFKLKLSSSGSNIKKNVKIRPVK